MDLVYNEEQIKNRLPLSAELCTSQLRFLSEQLSLKGNGERFGVVSVANICILSPNELMLQIFERDCGYLKTNFVVQECIMTLNKVPKQTCV